MEKIGISDDGFSGVPVFQVLFLAMPNLNDSYAALVLLCKFFDQERNDFFFFSLVKYSHNRRDLNPHPHLSPILVVVEVLFGPKAFA
jgi:hypothetical protein